MGKNKLAMKVTRQFKTRLNLYVLAFVTYWYAPVVYGMWLWHDLKMGAVSADSDSISIPLFAFVFLWFVGFPFFLLTTIAFEMLLRRRERRKGLDLRNSAQSLGTKRYGGRQIV